MPTNELLPDFRRGYARLTEAQKKAFRRAVKKFVIDLRSGSFRGSLWVKPLQDNPNIFEMTWEGEDGRATFDLPPSHRWEGGKSKVGLGYIPITPISSRTESADFCSAACSSGVSSNWITCSTPPAPSFTGTPTNSPLIPYSPSRYVAQGMIIFLSSRIESIICSTEAEGA